MRLRIDLKIFIFAVLFYITKQIEIYAMLMLFAILHECGHLLAGVLLKFKPEKINIMPMGLSISFRIPVDDYNKKIEKSNILSIKKIIIAFSGPLINLIIAILFTFFDFNFTEIQRLNIVYSNIIICLFNLVPIYPLDGGRILKQLLKIKKGTVEALRWTHIIQNVFIIFLTFVSSIAIYYFKNVSVLFIIVYLWVLVINENRKYSIKNKIYNCIKKSI